MSAVPSPSIAPPCVARRTTSRRRSRAISRASGGDIDAATTTSARDKAEGTGASDFGTILNWRAFDELRCSVKDHLASHTRSMRRRLQDEVLHKERWDQLVERTESAHS